MFSGSEFPCSKHFLLSLTLLGIARNALHMLCRVPLVTPDLLLGISRVLHLQHDAQSCTLSFAFLFAFFLMAHLANIVPLCNTFDPRGFLTHCDVASNELGLIVTFHCTKTIQLGNVKFTFL